MNVSLKWLKELVDIDLGVDDLAHQLTMLGLEIEAINRPGAGIDKVLIGKILEIKPHPGADKLVVCQTDVGAANPLQIVCGATNMKVGDVVPTATIGATLPGGFTIGRRKMRGVESQGMMCSARELGLGKDHDGLLILPHDMPVGDDAIPLLGLDDVIYEIEITPNRGDWAGMIGVARELGALFGRPLRLPDASVSEGGEAVAGLSSITIENAERCSRYVGRVIVGIRPTKTPLWMAQRLIHAGQRVVNPVVDITNYVLLETGQPLHAFDYDKLADHRIVVRLARTGESINTIDGVTRPLKDDMLVIADAAGPVAIAGVMGGRDSEVGEGCQRILLESACFAPSSIRKTARTLAMNTEASQRFQRGADPEMAPFASDRAARLINEICGGKVAQGRMDAYPNPAIPREVALRFDRTNMLLGTEISAESQRSILKRLHFSETSAGERATTFSVPSWRHDVTREADLIEEIARLYGYDNIPDTMPRVRKSNTVFAPKEVAERRLRRMVSALGLTELMGLTFSSTDEVHKANLDIDPSKFVRLQNPLSETSDIMRVSLIPNLLNVASLNIRRGIDRVWAYELGHIYLAQQGQQLPDERATLGIVLAGLRDAPQWSAPKVPVDIFDIKGLLESILVSLTVDCAWERKPYDVFEDGYAGVVRLQGNVIARYGKVKKKVAGAFDIDTEVFVAELDLEAILGQPSEPVIFEAPSTFPPSLRDLAVLVDADTPAGKLAEVAQKAGGRLLRKVDIFDVYTGKPIPAGTKSIALNLVFQSNEKTLTDKDTQKAWDSILKALEREFAATLR